MARKAAGWSSESFRAMALERFRSCTHVGRLCEELGTALPRIAMAQQGGGLRAGAGCVATACRGLAAGERATEAIPWGEDIGGGVLAGCLAANRDSKLCEQSVKPLENLSPRRGDTLECRLRFVKWGKAPNRRRFQAFGKCSGYAKPSRRTRSD